MQGNFFAGETFLDLADARSKMTAWLVTANARVHGTTRQVPAVVFAAQEAPCLLPAPAGRYQVPYWAEVKVHVDYHIQVARALYSVPWRHVGARVMARADEHLVKVYLRDQLIKTHPRRQPGGRSTDVADMPPGVEGYATRTVDRMVAQAASYGPATGIYARRLLDGDAPWMMMRSVYRLIGLAKRYGPQAAEAACARALDVDVINVSKIESMLKNATENTPAAAAPAAAGGGRPVRPGRGRVRHRDRGAAAGRRRRQRPRRQRPVLTGPASCPLPQKRAARGGRHAARSIPSPDFLFIPFLPRAGKEKERPLP